MQSAAQELLFPNRSGCSNHGCIIREPQGMGTNGICGCLSRFTRQEIVMFQHRLALVLSRYDLVEKGSVRQSQGEAGDLSDAQVFKLAVERRMKICQGSDQVEARAGWDAKGNAIVGVAQVADEAHRLTATRLAILSAAQQLDAADGTR